MADSKSNTQQQKQEFAWLDLRSAVECEPEPLDFVIPGLKSGTVGAIVSPGATGKTMLALQAAVAVATGTDLLDFASMDDAWHPTTGRVTVLTGEDPSDVLSGRFHTIGRHLSPQQREALYSNLGVAPLMGFGPDVMSSQWQHWVSTVTAGTRLVIIDTLRRFHQLDENDGGDMARVLAYMEQLCRVNGTTVLFLHHTNKAGALNAADAQQASRGSSVLTDNARFQANLVVMSPADAEKWGVDEDCRRNFVRLSFPKINYSAPIADKWYRRVEGGVLVPAVLEKQRKGGGSKSVAPRSAQPEGNSRDDW